MDDLSFLRQRVTSYADYRDRDSRHLVDKQVRAFVGEALSLARQRLGVDSEPLDQVIFKCGFTDQHAMRVSDHGSFTSDAMVDRIHALDRALVEAADRAAGADESALTALATEIDGLLDERIHAIESAPVKY